MAATRDEMRRDMIGKVVRFRSREGWRGTVVGIVRKVAGKKKRNRAFFVATTDHTMWVWLDEYKPEVYRG